VDIEKLILLGRLEEIVVIDGVKFKLATPHYNGAREWGSDTTDALAIVCNMIEQIDGENYTTKEQKEGLKKILGTLQAGVVGKLFTIGTSLLEKQTKTIDDLISKKE